MDKNNEIGVITEQGFVAGSGLGWNPVSESDQKKIKTEQDKNK